MHYEMGKWLKKNPCLTLVNELRQVCQQPAALGPLIPHHLHLLTHICVGSPGQAHLQQ